MNPAQTQKLPGIRMGLIGGVSLVVLALIGIVEAFNERQIIADVISMGHTLLLLTAAFIAYLTATRSRHLGAGRSLGNVLLASLIMTAMLATLVLIGQVINLRQVFINASPVLYQMLTFHQENLTLGIVLLLAAGLVAGFLIALLHSAPAALRRVLIIVLISLVIAALLQDMLQPILGVWSPLAAFSEWLFATSGLSVPGAIALAVLMAVIAALWRRQSQAVSKRIRSLPQDRQRNLKWGAILVGLLVLLVLPSVLGIFLSEVLTIIGLYVLLGLGLNIVVGFAGLLDLGYVAFFAIGSYTVAILTSPEIGAYQLGFWQALPVAIVLGTLAGAILGIPVLKMRGDYLAITTLGFGEIIRLLVLSDVLRPWLGGAQGIARIPKASILGFELSGPQEIYYLLIAGCFLVGFVSWRLRDSRLGRAWMAMREDEDVAQAMGINLVSTKLLAFATGAGFSALSGAIFATKLGSVYPHSFNVMISINILCLIIVGGMGSMPGVIVGAIALVGMPELLREFAEYRLLVYGAALVAMMLLRPEGLWPEAMRKRELHEGENGSDRAGVSPATGSGS
jgi:branched-chain amino acid transport system permease protein